MRKIVQKIKCLIYCRDKKRSSNQQKKKYDYFEFARTWADDCYINLVNSRRHWRQICLYIMLPVNVIFIATIMTLVPLQHLQPLLVNHYDNGLVDIQPIKKSQLTIDKVMIQSEIARYVTNRESYSATSFDTRYQLVNMLSNKKVARQYRQFQNINNTQSPIALLKNNGYRIVHIQSIVLLDRQQSNNRIHQRRHRNLAQVNFIAKDHNNLTGKIHITPFTALISWCHRGIPKDPSVRWLNWNGFNVTYYEVQKRNTD